MLKESLVLQCQNPGIPRTKCPEKLKKQALRLWQLEFFSNSSWRRRSSSNQNWPRCPNQRPGRLHSLIAASHEEPQGTIPPPTATHRYPAATQLLPGCYPAATRPSKPTVKADAAKLSADATHHPTAQRRRVAAPANSEEPLDATQRRRNARGVLRQT